MNELINPITDLWISGKISCHVASGGIRKIPILILNQVALYDK